MSEFFAMEESFATARTCRVDSHPFVAGVNSISFQNEKAGTCPKAAKLGSLGTSRF